MSVIAVIGDIGGHAAELRHALINLGADRDTLRLPPGLVVVQLGDLVHRGPDSPGVLSIVERALTTQPEQWVQLVGNHEGLYLPGAPAFHWPELLPAEGARLLNDWWDSDRMQVACAVRDDYLGDLLITHAGLTANFWAGIGRPADAASTAAQLNAMKRSVPGRLWRTGAMIDRHSLDAGPMWAEAVSELYSSWLAVEEAGTGPAPFGQIHGHSSALAWPRGTSRGSSRICGRVLADPLGRRHAHSVFAGRPFVGIDPDLGRDAGIRWAPLVLTGTVLAR